VDLSLSAEVIVLIYIDGSNNCSTKLLSLPLTKLPTAILKRVFSEIHIREVVSIGCCFSKTLKELLEKFKV
jgi:hypothetical protein